MTNYIQKTYDIIWFFPEMSMVKESCNKIGRETQLTKLNQKG